MYNKELNERSTEKLRQFCKDKKVIIVGNSVSLFANEYGDMIDSYDVVVRMGKGVPYPEFKKYLGSKTDCWMLSALRATSYKYFKNVRFKVLNITQLNLYQDTDKFGISKCFFEDDLQIYKDFFLIGNIEETKDLIKKAHIIDLNEKNRISQGAMCISYFLNKIATQKETHIIGFDFFESRVQYLMKGEVNEVSSFHMPIPLFKGPNSNPHTGLYSVENKDKEYIMDLANRGLVHFHEMENKEVPEQQAKMLLRKHRPGTELV